MILLRKWGLCESNSNDSFEAIGGEKYNLQLQIRETWECSIVTRQYERLYLIL